MGKVTICIHKVENEEKAQLILNSRFWTQANIVYNESFCKKGKIFEKKNKKAKMSFGQGREEV